MRSFFLLALFSGFFLQASSMSHFEMAADTTDTGLFGNAQVSAKMIAAKHEFNENNMRGALTIYREVLEMEPGNESALYWTARCHYELKKYRLAQEYLDQALGVNPDIGKNNEFFQGKIYQRLAQLDEAIASFEAFLKENEGKRSLDVEDAERYISECKFAKEMMGKPAEVSISNLGREVNSRYDDYSPSITADGKLLVFTSRRASTVGAEIDEGSDYKFFEDIFYSEWNAETKSWGDASGLEGEVNTPTYDAVLSISPDGKQIFVYKNNLNSAGDIFMSTLNSNDNSWRAPEKMPRPINTSYFESSISITQDGQKVYFISERGGFGQGDIYVSEKKGNSWSKPENLGEIINTPFDEKFVFIHPNGKTLYFASDGHQCLGSYDIFKTEFVNGQWSIPINLGYPINTVNEESTFSLTSDNKTMLIAAEYGDTFGERDIYQIDVSKYPLISSGYESSGYGTLILSLEDDEGKVQKGERYEIRLKGSQRVITSGESDKLGLVRVNLPGNQVYIVSVRHKGGDEQKEIAIQLNDSKATVIKETFILK
jgi:Tol biopolymer transport system component